MTLNKNETDCKNNWVMFVAACWSSRTGGVVADPRDGPELAGHVAQPTPGRRER